VEGEEITMEDLKERLLQDYGKKELQQLITEKLVEKKAQEEKVKVGEEEIEKEIEEFIKRLGGKKNFQYFLYSQGINEEIFKRRIEFQILLKKLLKKRIQVKEEEMKDFFKRNREKFQHPELVKVRRVVVRTEEEAKEILKELQEGKDFSEVAFHKSIDPETRSQGGDMGYVPVERLWPELEEMVITMKKGEISPVIPTRFGFAIIKLEDRKPAEKRTYSEVREEIREKLLEEKVAKEKNKFINELWRKADIKIYLK